MWDNNSPWPSDMLDAYQNIYVPYGANYYSVAVTRYRNNNSATNPTNAAGGTENAWAVKEAIDNVSAKAVRRRAGGDQAFVDVFTGKGSPEAIAGVLSAFADFNEQYVKTYGKSGDYAVRRAADLLNDDKLSWTGTLQGICDEYIGLDCNGFVGNWLKRADRDLKLNEQSTPPVVRGKSVKRRMSVGEIEAWDVVVWISGSHIAVVENTTASPNKFLLCQSAGDGPIQQEYVLTEASPGVFTKTGGKNAASEVSGNVGVYSMW